MKSFDLVCVTKRTLFSMISCQVQKMNIKYNEYSHVGIIIKNDILEDIGNKIYMLHSSAHTGYIELCDLEKYIYSEGSEIIKIGWCKLKDNPLYRKVNDTDESYSKRITSIKKKINNFYNNTKNASFNYFIPHLVLPSSINIFHKKQKTAKTAIKKSYFCSNYVTIIYQLIDVINKHENPDTFFPGTLIKYKKKNKRIFEKPILLKI